MTACSPFPTRLERVRDWAGQAPRQARGGIIELDSSTYAALRHRFHDDGAEAAPTRRSYGRPIALGPAHREGVGVGLPGDMDTAPIRREGPVFPSIGSEFVECEPDRLRGSGFQAQLGAGRDDARTNEICEVRELGAGEVLDVHTAPLTSYQQVLIGRKRLDALGEALDEIFGISGGGLVSDRVHNAEHVLGAMIDLAYEEVLLFLALLAFGNVLDGANAHGPALTPGTLEISKPESLHPADLAVSPPEPELGRGALRFGGIERRLKGPNPFRVVRMHQPHDLFDGRLIFGNIENLLRAHIQRDHALVRIVLPRPELGYVDGNLQTRLALAQQVI